MRLLPQNRGLTNPGHETRREARIRASKEAVEDALKHGGKVSAKDAKKYRQQAARTSPFKAAKQAAAKKGGKK